MDQSDATPVPVVQKKKLRILHELIAVPLSLILAFGVIQWQRTFAKRQAIPELAEVQAQAIVPTFVITTDMRGPIPGPIVAKVTAVKECGGKLCITVTSEAGKIEGLKAPIESGLKPGVSVVIRYEYVATVMQV